MSAFYKLFYNWKPNLEINYYSVKCSKTPIIAIRLEPLRTKIPSQLTEFIIPNYRYKKIIEVLSPLIENIDIEFVDTPDEDDIEYLSYSLRKAVSNNRFLINDVAALISYFEDEYNGTIMKLEVNINVEDDSVRLAIWGDGTIYTENEYLFQKRFWPTITSALCEEH